MYYEFNLEDIVSMDKFDHIQVLIKEDQKDGVLFDYYLKDESINSETDGFMFDYLYWQPIKSYSFSDGILYVVYDEEYIKCAISVRDWE